MEQVPLIQIMIVPLISSSEKLEGPPCECGCYIRGSFAISSREHWTLYLVVRIRIFMSRFALITFLILFISASFGASVQHELNDVRLIYYSSTSSPSASISNFSAVAAGHGDIDLTWEITGTMEENDEFKVYVDDSEHATLNREDMNFQHVSNAHGESFSYTVKICNEYGCNSTEGSGVATSDKKVDPASGTGGLTFTEESTSILIAWTSTNTSDVNNWGICWDEETFSEMDVRTDQITCVITGNESQSHSLPKKNNSGTHTMYVSVGGMDILGNIEYNGQMGNTQYTNEEIVLNNGSADNGTGGNQTNGSSSSSGTQAIPSVGMVGTIVAICVGFISTTRRLRSEDKEKYA